MRTRINRRKVLCSKSNQNSNTSKFHINQKFRSKCKFCQKLNFIFLAQHQVKIEKYYSKFYPHLWNSSRVCTMDTMFLVLLYNRYFTSAVTFTNILYEQLFCQFAYFCPKNIVSAEKQCKNVYEIFTLGVIPTQLSFLRFPIFASVFLCMKKMNLI